MRWWPGFDSSLYRTHILKWPIRIRVYRPDILRYQVTDLIWLGYHDHLAEFWLTPNRTVFVTFRRHIRL